MTQSVKETSLPNHSINQIVYDTRLMFLNILYLMSVAFIPFPTRVLIENGNMVSTIFYALSMTVVGLLSAPLDYYAFHNNRLTDPPVEDKTIQHRQWQSLLTPSVFLLSAGNVKVVPIFD